MLFRSPPPPPPPPAPAPPAPPRALTEDELFAKETLDQLNARTPLGDVLFDYDASTIREDQRGMLQKNADFMRRWLTTRISVEGHADSRGTNEYNLALGQRRANAVRDYLVSLGVSGDRLSGKRRRNLAAHEHVRPRKLHGLESERLESTGNP